MFNSYLDQFKEILSKGIDKKKEILELKQKSSNDISINYRQSDAISSRCDNYLNGTAFSFIESGNIKTYKL